MVRAWQFRNPAAVDIPTSLFVSYKTRSSLFSLLQPRRHRLRKCPQIPNVIAQVGTEQFRIDLDILVDKNIAETLRFKQPCRQFLGDEFSLGNDENRIAFIADPSPIFKVDDEAADIDDRLDAELQQSLHREPLFGVGENCFRRQRAIRLE